MKGTEQVKAYYYFDEAGDLQIFARQARCSTPAWIAQKSG